MGNLSGSSTAEIDAPIEKVWEVIEDVATAPQWQGGVKAMRVIDRDGEGRAVRVESENDAKVRTVKSTIRFTYEPPTRLSWTQEKGELKSVDGHWLLEDLGGSRTRATYSIETDLGRMLGMVIRGPIVGVLRDMLAGARAGELKGRVESGG